jgi:hypothetical protein
MKNYVSLSLIVTIDYLGLEYNTKTCIQDVPGLNLGPDNYPD